MKSFKYLLVSSILFFTSTNILAQTSVMIGPRVTGNFNIYNEKGSTGSWSGIGVGIGGTVDVSFSRMIGMMVNLTFFDMKNWGNTITQGNQTTEFSRTLSYLTVDPLFKLEFSGFYMVAGPSLGIKLGSSGEQSAVVTGQPPQITPQNFETKTIRFDIAAGTGYTIKLASDMGLGMDFMAYIPLSDTYNFPGLSNSIFTLKFGVALKFKL